MNSMRIRAAIIFLFFCGLLQLKAQSFDWARMITGPGAISRRPDIRTDTQNNIYISGSFNGLVDFDPSAGTATMNTTFTSEVFIAKYDPSGNYLWSRRIGGDNIVTVSASETAADGSLYLCGSISGTAVFGPGPGSATLSSSGSTDIFVAVYDANGDLLRIKKIGGPGTDYPAALAFDKKGRLYLAGNFSGPTDFDPPAASATLQPSGLSDVFVACYDSLLNYNWVIGVGGSNLAECSALSTDSSGTIVVAGNFNGQLDFDPGPGTVSASSAGNYDMFIAAYSDAGNLLWQKTMGGPGSEYIYDLRGDAGGNLYTTGTFSAAIDLDPGPGTLSLTDGKHGIFLASYTSSGAVRWASKILSEDLPQRCRLFTSADGNILFAGYFTGYQDADPGPFSADHYPKGEADLFMAKYESNGAFMWSRGFGGYYDDRITGICQDNQDGVLISGLFQDTLDFDPGTGISQLVAEGYTGNNACFFARYKDLITGLSQVEQPGTLIQAWPNPFVHEVRVSLNLNEKCETEALLLAADGRTVELIAPAVLNGGTWQFKLQPEAAPGIYLLKIRINNTSHSIKLLKTAE